MSSPSTPVATSELTLLPAYPHPSSALCLSVPFACHFCLSIAFQFSRATVALNPAFQLLVIHARCACLANMAHACPSSSMLFSYSVAGVYAYWNTDRVCYVVERTQ